MTTTMVKSSILSQNAIDNFVAFSSTLRRIHTRLIDEGYTIKDGKIIRPNDDNISRIC